MLHGRLFAINSVDGSTIAVFTIRDASNCDWEDITLGPGPEGHTYIYIGDVGGNSSEYQPSSKIRSM